MILFLNSFIDEITDYTNYKLNQMWGKYRRASDVIIISTDEIMAILGLLYLAGVLILSHQIVKICGIQLQNISVTMSYRRFLLLLRALRFDDFKCTKVRKPSIELHQFESVWRVRKKVYGHLQHWQIYYCWQHVRQISWQM